MINDVIYELLNELGLAISNDNYIVFQNGQKLKFNSKDIRFSYEDRFMIDGTKEIWFDPINNGELIKNLYNYYTIIHYDETKNKIINTIEEQDTKSFKHRLHISFIDKDQCKCEMNTPYYNNINVGYIQIIVRDILDVSTLDNK